MSLHAIVEGMKAARWYARNAEPLPEFKCAFPSCEERFHDEGDMLLCEGNGERFCKDHVVILSGLQFCAECATCCACAAPAVLLIDGELACEAHKDGTCACLLCGGAGEIEDGPMDNETGRRDSITCGNCKGEGRVRFAGEESKVTA